MCSTVVSMLAPTRYVSRQDDGRDFEYLVLTCQPGQSLAEARRHLAEHTEYGRWELRRSVIYSGGLRRYWMRRRMMRVTRTA